MEWMPGQPSPRFHEAFPDYPSEDHSLEKREEAISCLKHEKKCFFRLFGFLLRTTKEAWKTSKNVQAMLDVQSTKTGEMLLFWILFLSIDDSAFCKVVWGHFNLDPVAWDDLDVVLSHPT